MRLDIWLTEKGVFDSRSRARKAIDAGNVRVNGEVVTKASFAVEPEDRVEAEREVARYVSRGGFKLEKAIRDFQLDFKGKTVLDVGAASGGFTDCALQHGATKVFAVDLAQNHLHETLVSRPEIVGLLNTDIRTMDPAVLGESVDWILVDVQLVHLRRVLMALPPFLNPEAGILVLVKPQFEPPGRKKTMTAVAREDQVHRQVTEQVRLYALEAGFMIQRQTATDPAEDGKGLEYFYLLRV